MSWAVVLIRGLGLGHLAGDKLDAGDGEAEGQAVLCEVLQARGRQRQPTLALFQNSK